MKIEARNSLKPHWNAIRTRCLRQIKFFYDPFNQFGSYRNMEFLLSFRRKAGKDKPESSGLDFLKRFLGNNCALSDAEYNFSGLLNREDISD